VKKDFIRDVSVLSKYLDIRKLNSRFRGARNNYIVSQ